MTEVGREQLNSLARRGRSPGRMIKRALALLRTDQGLSDRLIAEGLAISPHTVARVRKHLCEEGLEGALNVEDQHKATVLLGSIPVRGRIVR